MPLFLVEALSQFRMRYVVEAEKAEYAADTVTMEEAEEFGQTWLGETIVSTKQVSSEELPSLFFEDHPYLAHKDIDFTRYITKIDS